MKRIIILLACVVLAGCAPTETAGTDLTTSPVAVSSENVSSEDTVSKKAKSVETKSKKEISSKALSSTQVISSEAISSEKQAEKTSSVPFLELPRKEQAKLLKETYPEYTNMKIEFAPERQDPCILNINKVYYTKRTAKQTKRARKEKLQPIGKAEKKSYAKMVLEYEHQVLYEKKKTVDANTLSKEYLDWIQYYGVIDGYKVFYCPYYIEDGWLAYNRIGGYQFLAMQLRKPNTEALNNQSKENKNVYKIDRHMYFCGLYLIKGDRVRLMEELYLEGEIGVETVGKIYNALPSYLQCGKFEHYQEAFTLAGGHFDWPADYRSPTDVATYFDRDGKFHVVVA